MKTGKNMYVILSFLLVSSMLLGGCGGQTADTSGTSMNAVVTAPVSEQSESAASESGTSDQSVTTTSVSTSSDVVSQSEEKTDEEVSVSSAAASSVSADSTAVRDVEEQKAELVTLLDTVRELESGTAGSSLRTAAATSDLCDFCSETILDEETLKAVVNDYISSHFSGDSDGLKLFKSNFSSVEEDYKSFIDSSEDESGILSDAGVSNSGYPYNYQNIVKMDEICSLVDAS